MLKVKLIDVSIVEADPSPSAFPPIVNIMTVLHILADMKNDACEIVFADASGDPLAGQFLFEDSLVGRESIDVHYKDLALVENDLSGFVNVLLAAFFTAVVLAELTSFQFELFSIGNSVNVGVLTPDNLI